jgi:eukaryotic-like serine/threonine-protein kinase
VDDDRSEAEYEDGQVVPGTSYRVVRLLGSGGMGQVYEVEHVEIGRRYVLKTLLSTLALRQDLIARMRNEWRALGRLRHPNIVDVVYAGTTATTIPFYVMELLDGETLRDRLSREHRLAIPDALGIALQILFGLEAAHAIGVIHRDIKPANVFLTRDGGVKVLDFGIAKVRLDGAPKITAQGLAIGTPRYMSPEQAMGSKADSRSDIYAMGLVLFEMLSGDGPFHESTDSAAQMLAHVNRPPPPLSQLVDVPKELEAVVASCLSKNPEQRPPSARAMASRIESLLPPAKDRAGGPAPRASAPPRTPTPRPASPHAMKGNLGSAVTSPPAFPAKPGDSSHRFSPIPGPIRPGDGPSLREKLFAETSPARQEVCSAPRAQTPSPVAKAGALALGLALAGATGLALFHLEKRSDPASQIPTGSAASQAQSHAVRLSPPFPAASRTNAVGSASTTPAPPAPPAAPTPSTTDPGARPGTAKGAPSPAKAALPKAKTDMLPGSGL